MHTAKEMKVMKGNLAINFIVSFSIIRNLTFIYLLLCPGHDVTFGGSAESDH